MNLDSCASVPVNRFAHTALVHAALVQAPTVRRRILARFPGLCRGMVDDAIQSAMVTLVADPAPWHRAWRDGGETRLRALLHVVAWRQARGSWRRHGWRRSTSIDAIDFESEGQAPAQLAVATFHMELDRAIEASVAASHAKDQGRVRAALVDSLLTGDTDGVLAERHGTRREYVNRARRSLARWREE